MSKTLLNRLLPVVLSLSLCALSSPGHSSKDFYKWEDENGVVHYSAHPPKDKANTKVRTTNIYGEAAPTGPSAAEKAIAENTKEEVVPKDPKRCAAARKNLKTLTEKSRIRIKEGDDYRFLTPAEIGDKTKTAREIIKQEC
ncbi:MAG: DUF4124 domain-containing protein [Cellvibrionaceae bacterium]